MKVFFGTLYNFNDSVLFFNSSTLSKHSILPYIIKLQCFHQEEDVFASQPTGSHCKARFEKSPGLRHCSMILVSYFHHVNHCKWGAVSNTAVSIVRLVNNTDQICFTKSECIAFKMTASLNLFKSNIYISTGLQLTFA